MLLIDAEITGGGGEADIGVVGFWVALSFEGSNTKLFGLRFIS